MPLVLIANSRADEICPIGIKALPHQQIDLAKIDVTQVDRDFFGVCRLRLLGVRPANCWFENDGRSFFENRERPSNFETIFASPAGAARSTHFAPHCDSSFTDIVGEVFLKSASTDA